LSQTDKQTDRRKLSAYKTFSLLLKERAESTGNDATLLLPNPFVAGRLPMQGKEDGA